ncbi:RHS repeat domain-containing protein [Aquimarina sp. 2304DJ70-9]|uniref:RHS repeat domain-containing protein n=1 Tax=Aquimarina penaris TaxID=3231044 RepID=UPI0034623FBC
MRNLKSYIIFCLVMVVIGTTKAQNLNWYQNTGFDVIDANTVSGNGNLLSLEVLSEEQPTGYFEIRNFKVDGNNLAPFVETKFSSASIFLSQTASLNLSSNNGYAITIALDTRNDLLGNRYTITAKKPDGTELGRLNDIVLQTTDRIRIEKISSSQLRFFFNNQIMATVTDSDLSWNRAGIKNYNLIEAGSNAGVLSVSYAQNGFEITDDSYGPFNVTDTDKNWVSVNSYGITENVEGNFIGASVSYYDNLGKGTQSQSFDLKGKKTWASEIRYDHQGRPALSTLTAPIGSEGAFTYKDGFIKKSGNADFNISDYEKSDIENPTPVTSESNTLGWYYSQNNNNDPYQDITNRPYSRAIYSELNPGTALKTVGGNKMDEEWKQGYVFSMPAGQELSKSGAFGETKYNNYKIVKTVARDVHGVESVIFTDTDGKTLAAARSGNEEGNNTSRESTVTISEQKFVDIHIPVGLQGITVTNENFGNLSNNHWFEVYNLITEQKITAPFGSLSNGFYRISYVAAGEPVINVTYPENYYDYSLSQYDKAGRLLSSKQPLKKNDGTDQKLESTFKYDALGRLTYSKNPDEGDAWFKYRSDGQIRFSQNSKQKANVQFSYTNYDQLGRPVESGVYKENSSIYFNSIALHSSLDNVHTYQEYLNDEDFLKNQYCSERHITTYDALSTSDLNYLETLDNSYATPSFLNGNVAKTWNENTTTYYSYDIYGRVQWIVQNITGLGAKTIDYEYDPVTSQVNRVLYQKYSTTDLFIHKYTYDKNDYSLTKVETSTDGSNYKEHAAYEYNETGALKQLNLAEGLQKIDYVYNLNGALKSINDPTLDDTNNPAQDIDDLFGMNLHYYNNDYARTDTPRSVANTSAGINQYNGNIKSITWNTNRPDIANNPNSYYYTYNKNNWLTGASYNQTVNEADPNISLTETRNQTVSTTENVKARQSIKLRENFRVTATSGLTFSAKITTDGTVQGDGDYNVSNITYDPNGNIQSLHRNKDTYQGSNAMDKLSYEYKTDKPNQLLRVEDAAGDANGADDIDTQTNPDNYVYNEIGQLVENKEENITYIYNASGLVTEVHKNNTPLVMFFYNDKNFRVRKESYNPNNGSLVYAEFYIRDAAGTAMAIYRKDANGTNLVENTIYGASRLGIHKPDGSDYYQLTDHLGNVRAVVTRDTDGTPIAKTATDYYPFGMPMPNRNLKGDYRYAYQGQEVDPETGKEAFQLRLWDSRIGRWLTTDPAGQFDSPYLGMGNNPLKYIDPDGAKIVTEGSWFFRLRVNFSLFLAKTFSKDARIIINELDDSPFEHKIVKGSINLTQTKGFNNIATNDSPLGYKNFVEYVHNGETVIDEYIGTGKGAGSIITWDTNERDGGLDVFGNRARPKIIGLLHELVHSWDINNGNIRRNRNHNGIKTSELRASNYENVFRVQLGSSLFFRYIPLRAKYEGKTILFNPTHDFRTGVPPNLPR